MSPMGKCLMGICRHGYMSHGYMSPNQCKDLKQILRKIKATPKPLILLKWFATWVFLIQKWLIIGLVRLKVKDENIRHTKCCIIKRHHYYQQCILKDLTPRLEFQLARWSICSPISTSALTPTFQCWLSCWWQRKSVSVYDVSCCPYIFGGEKGW